MRKISKNWICLSVIVIFSLLGMKALFHPGLFTAHDIWHQVVRFYYYSQAVNNGQFPPYWIDQLAKHFGYPLFMFSYHLPWMIGVLLLKVGFDLSNSIKFLFFLSYIVSGFTMYFFVSNLLKDKLAALLSAILYLWLPYHFLVIFVSASMGIAFVFACLPLIFLGIHLLKEESRFGPVILAFGLSGVILSHIMHLIFIFPIVLFFTIWEFNYVRSKASFIKNICFGIVLGILVSSFYLIPATYYNQFTRVHQEEGITKLYERNFITLNQLIYSKWGFSPIVNNAKNGEISFQLGIVQWISIVTIFVLIIFKKLPKTNYTLSIYLLLSFTISIFLMLDSSSFLWKSLVSFVVIDFPFRLLMPASFIASLCASIVLTNIPNRLRNLTFSFLILITIYTNRNHLNVNLYTDFPISTYLNLETEITTNTFNEYLPIQASTKLLNKPWDEIVGKNLSVSNNKQTTNSLSFNVNALEKEMVSIGQFYFPGQTLYLDNRINQFDIDKEGRISFVIPDGFHTIMVKYQDTNLIKISKLLTIVGILILLLSLFKINLRKKSTFN